MHLLCHSSWHTSCIGPTNWTPSAIRGPIPLAWKLQSGITILLCSTNFQLSITHCTIRAVDLTAGVGVQEKSTVSRQCRSYSHLNQSQASSSLPGRTGRVCIGMSL